MGVFDWLFGPGRIPTIGQIGAYNPPTEWGVDVQTPFHTLITAPLGGTVERVYTSGWGGNVVIQAQYMGQTVNEYVQHLDTIASNLTVGTQVAAGQFLGLSGGETQAQVAAGMYPGAQLPNSSQWSSGPHTEFGFNAPWQGGGPTINPTSFLQNLASGNGPGTQNLSTGGQGLSSSGSPPWWCAFYPNDVLCQAVQDQVGQVSSGASAVGNASSAIAGLINNLPRVGIALGAFLLIIIGLWHFMSKGGTTVNVQPSVMTQKAQGGGGSSSEKEEGANEGSGAVEAGEGSGAVEEAAAAV